MVLLDSNRRYASVLTAAVVATMSLASTTYGSDQDSVDSLVTLYNNLGVVKSLNEDFELAETYLDSALLLGGNDASVFNNLGNIHLCRGQLVESIRLYGLSWDLDSTDQKKLFNWSVALYMADSVDESVSMMEQFWSYATSQDVESEFVSIALEEMMVVKGNAKKISKVEIKKLLERAKEKRKKALMKKKKARGRKKAITKSEPRKSEKKKKTTTPAGEKSLESSGVSALLYWILL